MVKQARAHVGGDERGLDARNLLANEAHVLELLQPAGLTPRLVAFFQQEGDSFLAEEPVAGQTLRAWNAAQWEGEAPPGADALALARKVAAALALVHQRGVIVRDFTPNNLIIQPDGQLKLIDLELAVPVDGLDGYQADSDPGHRSLTPAYGSPEQVAGLTPALSDDSFALGAILCFLFTGEDPYIDPDSPVAKAEDPVGTWLSAGVRPRLMPPGMGRLALALTDPDPRLRPSAAGASIILRRLEERGPKGPRPSRRQLEQATLQRPAPAGGRSQRPGHQRCFDRREVSGSARRRAVLARNGLRRDDRSPQRPARRGRRDRRAGPILAVYWRPEQLRSGRAGGTMAGGPRQNITFCTGWIAFRRCRGGMGPFRRRSRLG